MKKFLSIIAILVIAVLSGACSSTEGPAVREAREYATKLDDIRQARDITRGTVARRINCALAADQDRAYSKRTGEPEVWVYRPEGGLLECYDTEGFRGPVKLLHITWSEVEEIKAHPDCYPLPLPPTSRQVQVSAPVAPVPQAVPVTPSTVPPPGERRQLGEGSCCGHR